MKTISLSIGHRKLAYSLINLIFTFYMKLHNMQRGLIGLTAAAPMSPYRMEEVGGHETSTNIFQTQVVFFLRIISG
jgi:hypothetical protein